MRDDAMMIRISVKTTKMYANGFNTPKNNGLNSGILLIIILTFEILFSIWKFLIFIFAENKILFLRNNTVIKMTRSEPAQFSKGKEKWTPLLDM